jgi:hypothetical protein
MLKSGLEILYILAKSVALALSINNKQTSNKAAALRINLKLDGAPIASKSETKPGLSVFGRLSFPPPWAPRSQ